MRIGHVRTGMLLFVDRGDECFEIWQLWTLMYDTKQLKHILGGVKSN